MDRRTFLQISGGAALSGAALPTLAASAVRNDAAAFVRNFRRAKGRVVLASAGAQSSVQLQQHWSGNFSTASVTNHGKAPLRIREIVLADIPHGFLPDASLYGESFQMLSQTAGTLAQPLDLGYSELKHYKLPQPDGATALSGMVTLNDQLLVAFTSCRRFHGRFYVQGTSLKAVLDTEGLELAPGESWQLEEMMIASGTPSAELTSRLAARIAQNHPAKLPRAVPAGWCSWYCFGPRV